MAQLRIFIPAARLHPFYAALRQAVPDGQLTALSKPLPVLDLSGLACFDLAVLGSSWRCRTPFVFPLMAANRDNHYKETRGRLLEFIPGVDWLVLGGSPAVFAQAVRAALTRAGHERAVIQPYLGLAGSVPRERRKADVAVRLRKEWFFVNHVAVSQIRDRLLELPEERWAETGYVAVNDHYPAFRPHIEARLARPPRLILELGCGLGQMTRSLAAAYPEARVVGLDVSRDSLDVARARFRLPNLEYREFDFANRYAFEDGQADLIISSAALNISSNQARTASETLRILAPGGLLVNACILEPFHEYWDFPASACLPTRSNLLPWDWLEAAARRGLGVEINNWGQANSRHYYASARLEAFEPLYRAMMDGLDRSPMAAYDYPHCTAFMSMGGTIPCEARPLIPPPVHPQAMEDILGAMRRAPEAVRALSELNWLAVAACHELFPEAADYLCAWLPGAADVIRRGLDTHLLAAVGPRAA